MVSQHPAKVSNRKVVRVRVAAVPPYIQVVGVMVAYRSPKPLVKVRVPDSPPYIWGTQYNGQYSSLWHCESEFDPQRSHHTYGKWSGRLCGRLQPASNWFDSNSAHHIPLQLSGIRATGFYPVCREFESLKGYHYIRSQLSGIEHLATNQGVGGSNPSERATQTCLRSKYPSRAGATTVKIKSPVR